MNKVNVARKRPAALVGILLLVSLAHDPAAAQDERFDAVTYTELQRRGGKTPFARPITTTGGAQVGVDINSEVKVDVDSELLFIAVLPHASGKQLTPQQQALVVQLRLLTASVRTIRPALTALEELQQAFAVGPQDDFAEFRSRYRPTAILVVDLQRTLQAAIRQRMIDTGLSPELAERASQEAMKPIFVEPLVMGYNWDEMRRLYTQEILRIEAALRVVAPDLGLKLEIRAHRLRGSRESVAIRLEGHNEVETGEETFYKKVRFEIPPEQAALHEQYAELAREMDEARSLGEVLTQSALTELELRREEIEELFSAVRSAVDSALPVAAELEKWADPDAWAAWLADLADDLGQTEEGLLVLAELDRAQEVYGAIQEDIEAFEAIAAAYGSLGNATSSTEALATMIQPLGAAFAGDILNPAKGFRALRTETWTARAEVFTDLLAAIRGLAGPLGVLVSAEGGPIADVEKTAAAVALVIDEVDKATDSAIAWFVRAVGLAPNTFAATLPEPAGQKQLDLGPEAELSTSFNLRTIKEGRLPDDRITLEYRFIDGTEEIPDLRWTDEFVIRVFGWQDSIAAGLAFTNRKGERTWQPTANLTWLLKHRGWPKDGDDDGLGGIGGFEWYSGFGISTMPLQFDADESVEIGIAATLSFLENRLIGGYGTNLQVDTDQTFWWLSIRLFEAPGMTNKGKVSN